MNLSRKWRWWAALPRYAPLLTCVLFLGSCSNRPAQVTSPPPEVLVVVVTPEDLPVVRETVATLHGCVNAKFHAQVQGYIISRVHTEVSEEQQDVVLFMINRRTITT